MDYRIDLEGDQLPNSPIRQCHRCLANRLGLIGSLRSLMETHSYRLNFRLIQREERPVLKVQLISASLLSAVLCLRIPPERMINEFEFICL